MGHTAYSARPCLDKGRNLTIVRDVRNDGSERPPSVRRTERLADGTLVTIEYNPLGRVVRETYYWSSDAEQLSRILERTLKRDAPKAD
jgi:YD repeat-containing protein